MLKRCLLMITLANFCTNAVAQTHSSRPEVAAAGRSHSTAHAKWSGYLCYDETGQVLPFGTSRDKDIAIAKCGARRSYDREEAAFARYLRASGGDLVNDLLIPKIKQNCSKRFVSMRPWGNLTDGEAEEILACYQTTDFWDAYDKYGFSRGNGGTGNGINVACTKVAANAKCEQGTKDLLQDFDRLIGEAIIIDRPGNYQFDGVGAAKRTVIVKPGLELVTISVSGHSRVYYDDSSKVECRDDHFDHGCVPL